VTETGLLIAQAAFLVLLYVFVWSLVRSSSKDLREATPTVVAHAPTAQAPPAPDRDAAVAVAADAPIHGPVLVPSPTVVATDQHAIATGPSRERPTGPAFELSVNIRPRLIVASSPSLVRDLEFPLETGMTLGRSRSNGIPISDQFASHMHARVFPQGHFFFIEDLGSTNGTFVNGRRIEGQTQLKVHDEIRLGETVLRYEE
jgi:hypothetical protein